MEIDIKLYNLNGNWMISVQSTSLNFRPIHGTSREDVIAKLENDGDSYFCMPGVKCMFIDGEVPKVRIV